VEMSRNDFDSYIASNRYPRRSAEIWNDDHMSEVALLGRDTPRRPLPDTRFSKQGDKTVFAIECSSCFEAAPGVGNVFVPGAAVRKKESNMADEAKADEKDEKDEMSKILAEKDAEIARLKEENRKMYNQTAVHIDADAHKDDEEDDDEDEKEENMKDTNLGSKHGKSGAKIEFARMKEKFEKRIAALETELAKERFSRELDAMESDGFAVGCCRDEMIEELVSSSNPQRKIAFWRENFRRDPINTRIAAAPRSGVKPEQSGLDRETVAKLVAEAAGDPDKFKTLMARAKSGV
jgi:hypothetical protein